MVAPNVSALYCHLQEALLVPSERCSIEEQSIDCFYAYVNEMHGSRSKIRSKNLVRQLGAEGFNSGVEGLKSVYITQNYIT
jgi:hypothetical protein